MPRFRLQSERGVPVPGSRLLPARNDGRPILFRLSAKAPPPPVYSAAYLDSLPPGWFEGRAVIVGVFTPYSDDWHLTPLRFADVQLPILPVSLGANGRTLVALTISKVRPSLGRSS